MNAILSRMTRYHTVTLELNGLELDVDYTEDDGVLDIDRVLTPRGDDLSPIIDWIYDSLMKLVEQHWEKQ